MMPKRIQRKRTKGWRMPPDTIYVGRGSRWGNPFTGPNAVKQFEELMMANNKARTNYMQMLIDQLRGKDLACWCSLEKPCHADILLMLANN
ncbi:MAG: DUF4326 domain-containing protein [Treponema sp.]|nr:DUF4326 domain-containing protein [Treponema sp.]